MRFTGGGKRGKSRKADPLSTCLLTATIFIPVIVGGDSLCEKSESYATDAGRPRRSLQEALRLASESAAVKVSVTGALCTAGGVRLCHQVTSGHSSVFTSDGSIARMEHGMENHKRERTHYLRSRRAVVIKDGGGQEGIEIEFADLYLASD